MRQGTVGIATLAFLSRAPSRFARLDGLRVHYKSVGRGSRAVVFVHGWSCNLSFWRMQAPALEGRVRALYVDLPGHGRSDKSETIDYTMDLFARAVDAVLRDARVDRAVLVGHSNGTPVLLQFYRLFPSKAMALVVVDGSLRPLFKDRAELLAFASRFRGSDYRERAARMIDGMTATMAPALRDWVRSEMLATPQHVMVRSFEATGEPGLFGEDRIDVPLLVVLAKSPFWTAEYETFVHGLAAKVDYRVMEGVSHFLMLDKPDEFHSILLAFLHREGLTKSWR